MKQRGRQPSEAVSRRHALATMVVAGTGFAIAAKLSGGDERVSTRRAPQARIKPWVDVCHWTVRFPDPASEASAMSDLPDIDDVSAILATLPLDASMQWTQDGVLTESAPVEIVRVLRAKVAGELSEGRVVMAAGWVLAETEWNIMRLAASQGVVASNAP